jgi:uncharacterized surface protein with fasciclin (FAS1) repeats
MSNKDCCAPGAGFEGGCTVLAAPAPEAAPEQAPRIVPAPLPEERGAVPPASRLVLVPLEEELTAPAARAGAAPLPEAPAARVVAAPAPKEPALAAAPAAPAPAGERFTPAPVVFTPVSLPFYSDIRTTSGPVDAAVLDAAAPPSACRTLGEVLAGVPDASRWLALLKGAGLTQTLLKSAGASGTILVPINSAFDASIDARPVRDEATLGELVANSPDLQLPLAGYHTVQGLWPAATLTAGAQLSTSNKIGQANPEFLKIVVSQDRLLRGTGSSAEVLQADAASCGPTVVHFISQVLLPFSFEQFGQGPIDVIEATQVKSGR